MDNQEKRISREEAEKRILLGLEDIWSDYKKYNPAGKSLTIGISEDEEGTIFNCYNCYWEAMDGDPAGEDHEIPLRVFVERSAE